MKKLKVCAAKARGGCRRRVDTESNTHSVISATMRDINVLPHLSPQAYMLKQYTYIIAFHHICIMLIVNVFIQKNPLFLISSSGMCFLSMLFDSLKGIRISVYVILLALKCPLWEKYQGYKCESSLENKAVGKNITKIRFIFFLIFSKFKRECPFLQYNDYNLIH